MNPRDDGSSRTPERELVEHFFRREHGRIVASLTRTLGPRYLDLAEEAVQEATLAALRIWPFRGIPDRPAAWLQRVARNHALDRLKRERRFEGLAPSVAIETDAGATATGAARTEHPLADRLRLIFACCHPKLSPPVQLALTLKLVCGFSVFEISRSFLAPEATIAQRIVRAKREIKSGRIDLELPAQPIVEERLERVLDALYLLFNEGYASHSEGPSIRGELVGEAIELTGLLTGHPLGSTPPVWALRALFLLQASRLPARIDAAGAMVPLDEQDRTLWNPDLVSNGLDALARAGRGRVLNRHHLLAGIAACHAVARDAAATDWTRILEYYDMLLDLDASFVVVLNRAVALAKVEGPARGLEALDALDADPRSQEYYLVSATRGELLRQLDRIEDARAELSRARELTRNAAERRYLARQIEKLAATPER